MSLFARLGKAFTKFSKDNQKREKVKEVKNVARERLYWMMDEARQNNPQNNLRTQTGIEKPSPHIKPSPPKLNDMLGSFGASVVKGTPSLEFSKVLNDLLTEEGYKKHSYEPIGSNNLIDFVKRNTNQLNPISNLNKICNDKNSIQEEKSPLFFKTSNNFKVIKFSVSSTDITALNDSTTTSNNQLDNQEKLTEEITNNKNEENLKQAVEIQNDLSLQNKEIQSIKEEIKETISIDQQATIEIKQNRVDNGTETPDKYIVDAIKPSPDQLVTPKVEDDLNSPTSDQITEMNEALKNKRQNFKIEHIKNRKSAKGEIEYEEAPVPPWIIPDSTFDPELVGDNYKKGAKFNVQKRGLEPELSLDLIRGVGPKVLQKLKENNITDIHQLCSLSEVEVQYLGRFIPKIFNIRGRAVAILDYYKNKQNKD